MIDYAKIINKKNSQEAELSCFLNTISKIPTSLPSGPGQYEAQNDKHYARQQKAVRLKEVRGAGGVQDEIKLVKGK